MLRFSKMLWLLYAYLLISGTTLFSQNFSMQTFTVDSGLPQSQVSTMYQDHKAYLWAGCYSGLIRFDGTKWKLFTVADGLLFSNVTQISGDRDGRLVLAFSEGGAQLFHQNRFREIDELRPGEVVTRVVGNGDDTIYIASRKGILQMISGKTSWLLQDPNPDESVVAYNPLLVEKDRLIYSRGEKLYAFQKGQSTSLIDDQDYGLIHTVIGDGPERYFVGTSKGLYLWEKGKTRLFADGPSFFSELVADGLTTEDKTHWFIVGKKLLAIKDGKVIHGLLENNLDNAPRALFYDREGNFWVSTDKSLNRFTPSPFSVYNKNHGLGNPFIRAIEVEEETQKIWLGTRAGVYIFNPDKTITPFHDHHVTAGIFDIHHMVSGEVMLATNAGLVICSEKELCLRYTEQDGLIQTPIQSAFEDHHGTLWIDSAELQYFRDNRWHKLPKNHPLKNHGVVQIKQDNEGWLWLATSRGVFRMDPETLETLSITRFTKNIAWSLDIDAQGRIWIATNGHGLLCYQNGRVSRYNTTNGLTDNFVWQVKVAANGDIWAGHNRGIDRIKAGNIEHFTIHDGIANSEMAATAIAEDASGNLYFGSLGGLTVYDPMLERKRTAAPRIYMEHVYADKWPLPFEKSELLELEQEQRNLRFNYSGVFFSDNVKFKYRLIGLNDNWSALTSETNITYHNLKGGTYEFEVRAVTDHGVPSQETASVAFSIEKNLLEKRSTYVVAILLFVGIGLSYARIRNRYLIRQQQRLEKLVAQRTEDLHITSERLKETQDLLLLNAHREGMSEVAAEVLHTTGNTLTSMVVSLDRLKTNAIHPSELRVLNSLAEALESDLDYPAQIKVRETLYRVIKLKENSQPLVEHDLKTLSKKLEEIRHMVTSQEKYVRGQTKSDTFDLKELLKEIHHANEALLKKHQIELTHDCVSVPLNAPKHKLRMVLNHILQNAIEAINRRESKQGKIQFILYKSTHISLKIKDNGCGIKEQNQLAVFSPDYTTKKQTLGLGLHYCANTLTEMKGSIRVTSLGIDKGTTVEISLPLEGN